MATVGGYSRHKMLEETNDPLYTNKGDGAVALVYSPLEQKDRIKTNLNMQVSATGGADRFTMPVPATATGTATLTTAQVTNGLLLGTPAAAAAYTLPTAASLDAAIPNLQVGEAIAFNVVNLATTDTFAITITTNTGWTLVGDMVVDENDQAAGAYPRGTFWARKTGTAAYTLYRVA